MLRAIALFRYQIPGAVKVASIALRCLDRDVHAAYVAAEPVEMARRSQQKSRQPLRAVYDADADQRRKHPHSPLRDRELECGVEANRIQLLIALGKPLEIGNVAACGPARRHVRIWNAMQALPSVDGAPRRIGQFPESLPTIRKYSGQRR